jgi:glutathione S-transferase
MLLYDCRTAPSPRRVRIFLAEKAIEIPLREVDLRHGEQFGSEFRAITEDVTVPVLELDDGQRLCDIIGICRYFEEVHPQPALFGSTPLERALIDGVQRWCDREGFYAVMDAFRNSTPGLKNRALPGPADYPQLAALAERSRSRIERFFERLDAMLGRSAYVAGPRFSIADITAMVSVDFAGWIKMTPAAEQTRLHRWLQAVRSRPSAAA